MIMTQEQKNLLMKDLCVRLPYDDSGMESEISDVKPYLLPLSSRIVEQRKEYEDALTYHVYVEGGWTIAKSFDLAIDASGLNIYEIMRQEKRNAK